MRWAFSLCLKSYMYTPAQNQTPYPHDHFTTTVDDPPKTPAVSHLPNDCPPLPGARETTKMSDDKVSPAVIGGSPVKPKKRQTCMRHCKRFWWIYLIVFICVVVLVVCLIIFVAVPKIAQHKIDEAHLEIQGVNVLQTRSDAYLMEINSTITTDGKIKANIDPFEGVMYLEDLEGHTPFVSINFPATNGDKHQTVNVSQEVQITDMAAFTTFNTWFTNNETLRVTVEGKTHVKPSGLSRKYPVDFKKTLEINGLNLFAGTRVIEQESNILSEPDERDRNFHGITEIPNHSVFTLDIGNVSFTNFIDDERVGTLWIENLVLHPGINRLDITANMSQARIISKVRLAEYCDDGIVPFKLLGDDVVNNGQDLSYFATALASANQTVPINIGDIIEKDFHFNPGCAPSS
ncbi:hypothetical protein HJFPF1_01048 [Paramyrothecium foliicola]|nr:hypothetical protein HJFPF1_01048 [Paramyrothecium foliicola]